MGVTSIFSRGVLVDFSKRVSRGAESGEIWFLPLEAKKTAFLLNISNTCLPSDAHACI